MVSESINWFCQYLLSKSIVNYLFSIDLNVWGYPTFLTSWFINFNWLCKHIKNVRSSQPYVSMNFCTEFTKAQIWALLNQTKATNFTTHGGDISLLHTRYRVSDSSHSVLGKDGCYIVPEPYLIYTILRYQKEVNKPLSKKVSEVAIGALLQKKLFVKIS